MLLRVPSLAERERRPERARLGHLRPIERRNAGNSHAVSREHHSGQPDLPPAANLLKLIPAPDVPASKDQPNYSGSGAVKFNDDAFNTRVDYYQTEKLHWFGRYSLADFRINSPGIYGVAGGPGYDPSGSVSAFAGPSTSLNHSVAAGFDYVVRPNLLTDFRFGFFRYQVHVVPNGLGHGSRQGRRDSRRESGHAHSPAACPRFSSTTTATTCSSSATPLASTAAIAR